jgi:hypothetical protein
VGIVEGGRHAIERHGSGVHNGGDAGCVLHMLAREAPVDDDLLMRTQVSAGGQR